MKTITSFILNMFVKMKNRVLVSTKLNIIELIEFIDRDTTLEFQRINVENLQGITVICRHKIG